MHFQYLCLVPFLYSLTLSLALPLSSSSELSLDESRNLENGADLLFRNSFDIEEREASNDPAIRDFLDSLIPREKNAYRVKKPVVKKTAARAQQRKENVRQTVKKNQAANKDKKAKLQQQAPPKDKPYGKPRNAKPGYRAEGRKKGYRLPKQPKTPKPNAPKGSEKSHKAKTTQAKAHAERKSPLEPGTKQAQCCSRRTQGNCGLAS